MRNKTELEDSTDLLSDNTLLSWRKNKSLMNPVRYLPPNASPWKMVICLLGFVGALVFLFSHISLTILLLLLSLTLLPYAIGWQNANATSALPFIIVSLGFFAIFVWEDMTTKEALLSMVSLLLASVLSFLSAYFMRQFLNERKLTKRCLPLTQSSVNVFGDGHEMGLRSESSRILEELTGIPGAKIMYGLTFPTEESKELLGAVVFEKQVVLVGRVEGDAKSYSWDRNGEVVKVGENGESVCDTRLPAAVKKLSRLLPDAQVNGYLIVDSVDPSSVHIDNRSYSYAHYVRMGTSQDALESIGSKLLASHRGETNAVDRHLLWRLLQFKA